MSIPAALNQVLQPIFRGEDVTLVFDPPGTTSYTLTGSTFEFAIGTTRESPTTTISGGSITFSGDTITVVIARATTAAWSVAGSSTRYYWTLLEITSANKENVIADGTVDVKKGAGSI